MQGCYQHTYYADLANVLLKCLDINELVYTVVMRA